MNLEETKFCSECKNCQEVVKKENGNYTIVCLHRNTEGINEDMLHGTVYCKFKEKKQN